MVYQKIISKLWIIYTSLLFIGCVNFNVGLSRADEPQVTILNSQLSGTVAISGPFDVILVKGSQLKADMPAKIAEKIVLTKTDNGVTTISVEPGLRLRGKGKVALLVGIDAISNLEINTEGTVMSASAITKSSLNMVLGGIVTGELNLHIDTLNLTVTTPRLIILLGNVQKLQLTATALSHVDMRRLGVAERITNREHGARLSE